MSAQERAELSVLLTVRNIQASLRFYRERLGFELKACWPNEREPTWCSLALDGQTIMLCTAPKSEEGGEPCSGSSEADRARFQKRIEALFRNQRGVGAAIYVTVPDVDAYHDELRERGVEPAGEPRTQPYGLRELTVDDPDGYELVFCSPVSLPACQSCGMPLTDAQPDQRYCPYCTNERGQLRPFEQVFEGTVTSFFMAVHKLPREEAEQAARKHLRKMPAWSGF